MDELIFASATQLAGAIRSREVSALEVVEAYLGRIAAVNPGLNAVVQSAAEAALAQARLADQALAHGQHHGPLHGVPFTVKDVFDTAGIVSAAGLVERASFIPSQDALVVARMRAAGAIVLAKTNCPPGGGGGSTENQLYGRTNNPYDLARSPAGSSGGEAALLAAGGSPLGLGSDSGGSIRVPCHVCGIAGLKPTAGRVPATGTFNHPGGLNDPRTQIGPMARRVEDLQLCFTTIAGVDWRDSAVVPMPVLDPRQVRLQGLRLAWYADDGQATPSPETAATVQAAAQALAEAGLVVEERRPAPLGDSRSLTERYWRLGSQSGEEIDQLYLEWDAFRSAMLAFIEHYDVLLCPVDAQPAFKHGAPDALLFNYTLPFSLTGWPCVVVRAGSSAEGLPIGVQVVARPWREDVALAVAAEIERVLGGWQKSDLSF